VLDDPTVDHAAIDRLVLCSGKLYYDIVGHEQRAAARNVAVTRIEQLYPFPVAGVQTLLAAYPRLREVVWAQEEPQNMGPWRSIRHRLEETVRESTAGGVWFVGRTWKASPSEGYPTAHQREQDRIVRVALGDPSAGG
jgi:2-oxoglutarate dehydrogenase E1 component